MKKLVIIGKGPAGISAALYAVRGGLDVTIVAKDGGALQKADKIDNYYGFDGGISARKLLEDGENQARTLGVQFVTDEVVGVEFAESGFAVKTLSKDLEANAVVLACGTSRNVPPIENIEKFEGRGVSYCAICDGFFFRKKKVGVIGSAGYAKSEYGVLKNIIDDVTILTDGKQPSFDSLPFTDKKIKSFEGGEKLEEVVFEDGTSEKYDGVFVACGSAGAFELAKKLGLEIDGNKIVTDDKRATNIPGVYAAGDCVKGLQQIAKAVYDGMLAGTQAIQYLKKN
jgi:thioredoxin-disulfide reductase